MSSTTKIDKRKKDVLILSKGLTQGLLHTLFTEKMYLINLLKIIKNFCLSLRYNGANSYLFVNGIEICTFKAKGSELVATPLCLGNISKDWAVGNMKKADINRNFYDFNADYDAIAVDDIGDIHKHLMKKNKIV